MKLHKKEKKIKDIISLKREYNILLKKIWNSESIPLDKPIFDGYVQYFKVRDDLNTHSDYLLIKKTLNRVGQNKVFCKNRSFLIKKKKIVTELVPSLNIIFDPRHTYCYSELSREKRIEEINELSKYLRYIGDIISCNCHQQTIGNKFIPHYEFKYPQYLEKIIKPYYLTHYKVVLPEIESRKKEIENKFDNNNGWAVVYGRQNSDFSEFKERLNRIKGNVQSYLFSEEFD